MAATAIVAVSTTSSSRVGVYALFQFEVTPATVIAFLTILGFSLYDTVVVFDKVDENNARWPRPGRIDLQRDGEPVAEPGADAVALTTLDRAAAVLSLLVVGSLHPRRDRARGLRPRAAVGLFVGAYSSIFVASPLLAVLKEREPQYRALARAAPRGTAPRRRGGRRDRRRRSTSTADDDGRRRAERSRSTPCPARPRSAARDRPRPRRRARASSAAQAPSRQ